MACDTMTADVELNNDDPAATAAATRSRRRSDYCDTVEGDEEEQYHHFPHQLAQKARTARVFTIIVIVLLLVTFAVIRFITTCCGEDRDEEKNEDRDVTYQHPQTSNPPSIDYTNYYNESQYVSPSSTDTEERSIANVTSSTQEDTFVEIQPSYDWNCIIDVEEYCESSVQRIRNIIDDIEGDDTYFVDDFYFDDELVWTDEGDALVAKPIDIKPNVMHYINKTMGLQHIFLPIDHVLDWVYHMDGMGGFPIVYVRHKDHIPFETAYDYRNSAICAYNDNGGTKGDAGAGRSWASYDYGSLASHDYGGMCRSYLDQLLVADTPQGYMDFITLLTMGDQFRLFWHSFYNDFQIICNQEDVEVLFATYRVCPTTKCSHDEYTEACDWECFNGDDIKTARDLDMTPTVQRHDNGTVSVGVVRFTKFGGLSRQTYLLRKQQPSASGDCDKNVLEFKSEPLIDFDVGYTI